jgi:hypothetical protein
MVRAEPFGSARSSPPVTPFRQLPLVGAAGGFGAAAGAATFLPKSRCQAASIQLMMIPHSSRLLTNAH